MEEDKGKILIIHACNECYYNIKINDVRSCYYNRRGNRIFNVEVIPDWCPLANEK